MRSSGGHRVLPWVRRVAFLLVGTYLGVIALGWLFQDRLIYLRSPAPPPADDVLLWAKR